MTSQAAPGTPATEDSTATEDNTAIEENPATQDDTWTPAYRDAVVDLLGVLAHSELTAFSRLAADAELAPTLTEKATLSAMAVAEYRHYTLVAARLGELGVEPEAAMTPFVAAVEAFHARTRPATWLEGLVKAYVGDGIATDFYREVGAALDAPSRDLVHHVLEDTGYAEFVVTTVRTAVEQNPRIAGRLALWGRRLVGEAITQAQQVAAERDALSALLIGGVGRGGRDLSELGAMFERLTAAHTERMTRLGLSG